MRHLRLDFLEQVEHYSFTGSRKMSQSLRNSTEKLYDNYFRRLDNHVANETFQKQLNKSQRNQGAKPKQRTTSINEKIALQSELEAKKRELEEIMGKHKGAILPS